MDDFKKYILFQKVVTESKLKVINRFLKKIEARQTIEVSGRPQPKTKTNLIAKILEDAGRPMTLKEIADVAIKEHKTQMKRDSMSSILTKKIQAGKKFIRTGPNTFSIREEDQVLKSYDSG